MPKLTKKNSKSIAKSKDDQLEDEIDEVFSDDAEDDYFVTKSARSKTSDNTLSMLGRIMDARELSEMRNEVVSEKLEEKKRLLAQKCEESFDRWEMELSENCSNLFIYGVGSKRKMIEKFLCRFQSDVKIIFDGFGPNAHVKQLLFAFLEILVSQGISIGSLGDVVNIATHVKRSFESTRYRGPDRIIVVIHNVDSAAFFSVASQNVLQILATIPQVKMIVSSDHISVFQRWDRVFSEALALTYWLANTWEDYSHETKDESAPLLASSGTTDNQIRGIGFILRSLTKNARGVFKILAKSQIQYGNDGGLSYNDFYQKCKDQFYVTSENGFKAHITEFNSHHVFISRKTKDATCFVIPLPSSSLKMILDEECEKDEEDEEEDEEEEEVEE
eukprot:TRINITY_DN6855_c0_g1_i1.p1 TRINITY_DN6855_c0_g1~~TRINITY_DN6855_c0_g1_i1.p1  ORF type:complete len:389 (+),score=120.92 TRINITY_DN6855_c0_g1_i1:1184-2350(+)